MLNRPLTVDELEGFQKAFLWPVMDRPVEPAAFHREVWADYLSDKPDAGAVAPRGHGKSSAFTFTYLTAELCFRRTNFAMIVSASEDLAIRQLSAIADVFRDGELLRETFGIKDLQTDAKRNLEVRCIDGYEFAITARGAEQKSRGILWKNYRPGLIVCDDIEEDECVKDAERRKSFREWFFRVLYPIRSAAGRLRIHGTILGEEALLAELQRLEQWNIRRYQAHAGYDDYSNILWPEQFNEERLRGIQQKYIESGDPFGYSLEYLNTPVDISSRLFAPSDIKPFSAPPRGNKYIGCDFAVSEQRAADDTSFALGVYGNDARLRIPEVRAGRWSAQDWMTRLLDMVQEHRPEAVFVEAGTIWLAVKETLMAEAARRRIWVPFIPLPSIKDKLTRSAPLQRGVRSGMVEFDQEGPGVREAVTQLLRVTAKVKSKDDSFDACSILVRGVETYGVADDPSTYQSDAVLLPADTPLLAPSRSYESRYAISS